MSLSTKLSAYVARVASQFKTVMASIDAVAATANSTKTTVDGLGDVYAPKAHTHTIANIESLQTTLNAKAPLASPTFTGTPKAPTAAAGTNTTQVATTAFVKAAVDAKTSVTSATKATQDASGNVITSTYATKTELGNDSFVGKIEMFYGTLDSTGKHPLVNNVKKTNWQICDGTNGTPDLRGKFVRGVSSSIALGTTGGSAEAETVDQDSFDYSMSTGSVATAMDIQTELPPYVALYYIMKIA